MTIRFDADKDKLVHRAHPYDKAERDGWAGDDETLWYLTDGNAVGCTWTGRTRLVGPRSGSPGSTGST